MTRKGFYFWEQRVTAFLRKNNLDTFSREDEDSEGEFSWRACECCGSRLGGTRYNVVGYDHKREEIVGPWSICTDCLFYNEYGHIGDGYMVGIGDDAERYSKAAHLTLRLIRRGWERTEHKHPGPAWNTLVDIWSKNGRALRIVLDRDYDTVVHVEKVKQRDE